MTNWVQEMIAQGGYLGLFLLMFAETIFPPIPSEVIMSMAGLQVAKGNMALIPSPLDADSTRGIPKAAMI